MYVIEFPEVNNSMYLCWDNQNSQYVTLYASEHAIIFPTEEKANEALDFMASNGQITPSNWHIIKADDVKKD